MNDDLPTHGAPKRRKYSHTRQLIRLALHDGMTQAEIARKCRTQQSQVSDWANGKRKAPEDVLMPLIEVYGHRLNRVSARVYLTQRDPEVPWEECELGRAVQEAQRLLDTVPEEPSDERRRALEVFHVRVRELSGYESRYGVVPRVAALRDEYTRGPESFEVVRVEGQIVFRHTFEIPQKEEHRHGPRTIRWVPARRWAVHAQGRNTFRLVESKLRVLPGVAWMRWGEILGELIGGSFPEDEHVAWAGVHSRDDAGRWVSVIDEQRNVVSLLQRTADLLRDEGDHDRQVVPFLIKKALVEAGYDVPGVRTLPASV